MKFTHKLLSGVAIAASFFAMSASSAQQEVKLGYGGTRTSNFGTGADGFCATLEAKTNQRFICRQGPAATLGSERELVEGAQIGSIDIAFVSNGTVGNFVPEARVLDLPYLFSSYEEARNALDGPAGQQLLEKFPSKGLIALAWGEDGFRHISTTDREINGPQDLANLKLRTMENRVHIEAFKDLGALPTPMAFPEVYPALQQGTIDGQENPLGAMLSSRFWQVQNNVALTSHVYSPTLFIISPALWNKLNDEDKEHFRQAARDGVAAQRNRVDEFEIEALELFEKEDIKVTRPDISDFQEALAPLREKYDATFGNLVVELQSKN